MNSEARRIEGIVPILSVPFLDDESIDVNGLLSEADFLMDRGVRALGVGYGSELPRLTETERNLITKVLVDGAAGRLPVMASVGADSTYAAIVRAEAAAAAGAGLLMVVPPAQPGAEMEVIFSYYAAIADRIPLPIVIQDAPTMTGVRMSPSFLGQLAREISSVVAVKVEELPTSPKIGLTVAEVGPNVTVLGGAGGVDFFSELTRGARGTVPGACHPEVFVRILELFNEGKMDESREVWRRYLPFLQFVSRSMDTFLIAQKEVLRRRGVLTSSRLRSPGAQLDERLAGELEIVLRDLAEDEILADQGAFGG